VNQAHSIQRTLVLMKLTLVMLKLTT